jgi:NADH dehydrogenase [ubiquinone] 1 alpha subcomplex assembly factor 7
MGAKKSLSEQAFLDHLKAKIEATGPIPLADFMTQALYDPQWGYYIQKIPIGREGDYITAPEMTQAFGEVIAIWLIDVWQKAGCQTPFHLIEMGAGRGTLMADILRTLQSLKIPLSEMSVHLVEISPPLKSLQQKALIKFPVSCQWHQDLTTLPQGFSLIIGNEFWDALPIQQFVQVGHEWIERRVGIKGNDLIFVPERPDQIRESCPAMPDVVAQMATCLKKNGGIALFLDYGYDHPSIKGDTLQTLRHHQSQSPLENIGQADLTHHVDFYRLKTLFQEAGLTTHGAVSQGSFLKAVGLEVRTEHLCEHATPDQRGHLRTAAVRLCHPSQMGDLFKALAVTNHPSLNLAGFS